MKFKILDWTVIKVYGSEVRIMDEKWDTTQDQRKRSIWDWKTKTKSSCAVVSARVLVGYDIMVNFSSARGLTCNGYRFTFQRKTLFKIC